MPPGRLHRKMSTLDHWSVWYGSSNNGGNTWGNLTEICNPRFGDSDIILDNNGNLILVYGRGISFSDGRWYQYQSEVSHGWKRRTTVPRF